MTKLKSGPQKGEKRRYTREAIESLGLDAKYADAAEWVKNKYGIEVSDPTFYHLRKEMQEEARRGQPSEGADQPAVEGGEPTPAGAASQPPTTSQPRAAIRASPSMANRSRSGSSASSRSSASRNVTSSRTRAGATAPATDDGRSARMPRASRQSPFTLMNCRSTCRTSTSALACSITSSMSL